MKKLHTECYVTSIQLITSLLCFENRNPRVYIDLESFPEGTQIGLDDRIDTNEDDTTLLPGPNVCGVEAVQNRIFGGDFTTLTEFPW